MTAMLKNAPFEYSIVTPSKESIRQIDYWSKGGSGGAKGISCRDTEKREAIGGICAVKRVILGIRLCVNNTASGGLWFGLHIFGGSAYSFHILCI